MLKHKQRSHQMILFTNCAFVSKNYANHDVGYSLHNARFSGARLPKSIH